MAPVMRVVAMTKKESKIPNRNPVRNFKVTLRGSFGSITTGYLLFEIQIYSVIFASKTIL